MTTTDTKPAPEGMEWQQHAACRDLDSDLFFPSWHTNQHGIKAAQEVCSDCPVQPECLEYALINNEKTGVWGGYYLGNPRVRYRLRRRFDIVVDRDRESYRSAMIRNADYQEYLKRREITLRRRAQRQAQEGEERGSA